MLRDRDSYYPETEVTNSEATHNEAGKPITTSDAIISIIQRKLDAMKNNNEDNKITVNLLDFPETNDKDIRFLFYIAKKQNLIVKLMISSIHIREIPASDCLETLVMHNCYGIRSLPALNKLKYLKIENRDREKVSIKWPESLPELTCCVLCNIDVENFPKHQPGVKHLNLHPAKSDTTDHFSTLPEDLILHIYSIVPNKQFFGSCQKKIWTLLFKKPHAPLYHLLLEKKWKKLDEELMLSFSRLLSNEESKLSSVIFANCEARCDQAGNRITASDAISNIFIRKIDTMEDNQGDNKLTVNLIHFPDTNNNDIKDIFEKAEALNLEVSLQISSRYITEIPASDCLENLIMRDCIRVRSLPVLNNLKYLHIENSRKQAVLNLPKIFPELNSCILFNIKVGHLPKSLPSLKYLSMDYLKLCRSTPEYQENLNSLLAVAPKLKTLYANNPTLEDQNKNPVFSISHPKLKTLILGWYFVDSKLHLDLKAPKLKNLDFKECRTFTFDYSIKPPLKSLTIKGRSIFETKFDTSTIKCQSYMAFDTSPVSEEDSSSVSEEDNIPAIFDADEGSDDLLGPKMIQ